MSRCMCRCAVSEARRRVREEDKRQHQSWAKEYANLPRPCGWQPAWRLFWLCSNCTTGACRWLYISEQNVRQQCAKKMQTKICFLRSKQISHASWQCHGMARDRSQATGTPDLQGGWSHSPVLFKVTLSVLLGSLLLFSVTPFNVIHACTHENIIDSICSVCVGNLLWFKKMQGYLYNNMKDSVRRHEGPWFLCFHPCLSLISSSRTIPLLYVYWQRFLSHPIS